MNDHEGNRWKLIYKLTPICESTDFENRETINVTVFMIVDFNQLPSYAGTRTQSSTIHLILNVPIGLKIGDKNGFSPFCSLCTSYGTSKENLSKYEDPLSLVITSSVLIT